MSKDNKKLTEFDYPIRMKNKTLPELKGVDRVSKNSTKQATLGDQDE